MEKQTNMKKRTLVLLSIALLAACLFAACGAAEKPAETGPKPAETDTAGIPLNSILYYNDDPGSAELMQFFADGNVPEEAQILYDQMGSNPYILITDPAIIRELYNRLSQVTVEDKSNMSITDSYHQVEFKLAEDMYIHYSFEGSKLWSYHSQNYDIANSGRLFSYMQDLTEDYWEQEQS